ncbi:hypothetical protein Tco_1506913 [Tanacetum coccineum]
MNQTFYNSNFSGFDQIQPPQYSVIHHPPQETSVEILQAREDLMKSIQTFLKKFNRISFRETPKVLSLAWEKFFEIQHAQPEDIQELLHKLLKDLQIIREELTEYINSPSWNRPAFYNDDDDEYTIQYREYLENSSNAITPVLPIEEPDNSLSMGDEHLSTIPETESDEVIKSSVKDLVPIPSESEGISKDTCDVPFCDNTPPLDVLNDHFEIFSDFNLLLHHDPSISVVSILKGFTDEPPLEENDDLFDLESKENDWKKILYDAPIDDLIIEDKVFDPGIHEIIFSPTYGSLPFEDVPDFEDSRAHGFVHSYTRASYPQLHLGNPISKSYRLTFIFSIINKRL